MDKRKEVSLEIKNLVVKEYKKGTSYRGIGGILDLPHTTVQYILKKYKDTGSVENKPRSGRPKKLSRRDVSLIVREVGKNPRISGPELVTHIANTSNTTVHPKTVRRVLHKNGYASRVPRKKPFISEKNKKLRLEFAKKHIDKDMEFWKSVIFTDESKFNLFGNDCGGKVWRRKNEAMQAKNLMPTVKHGGGSVMVWGAMAASGVGSLVFIDGIMDKHYYKAILEQNLPHCVESLDVGPRWIFQQDNDPKHTAKIVKEWLLYYAPRQLYAPPQSPDLNPIEHVWEILKRKVGKVHTSSKDSLKNALKQSWAEITPDVTNNLIQSMPRRLQAVIESRGGPTKY